MLSTRVEQGAAAKFSSLPAPDNPHPLLTIFSDLAANLPPDIRTGPRGPAKQRGLELMRIHLIAGAAAALVALFVPLAAHAESAVALSSAVFVEHATPSRGAIARSVEPASTLSRGQRVVLVVDWRAPRRGESFTVTTPIPAALAFQRSSSEAEEVSVDGGRSWGRLGELQLRDAWGARLATAEDVTHVRWRMRRAEMRGRIAYSALVR